MEPFRYEFSDDSDDADSCQSHDYADQFGLEKLKEVDDTLPMSNNSSNNKIDFRPKLEVSGSLSEVAMRPGSVGLPGHKKTVLEPLNRQMNSIESTERLNSYGMKSVSDLFRPNSLTRNADPLARRKSLDTRHAFDDEDEDEVVFEHGELRQVDDDGEEGKQSNGDEFCENAEFIDRTVQSVHQNDATESRNAVLSFHQECDSSSADSRVKSSSPMDSSRMESLSLRDCKVNNSPMDSARKHSPLHQQISKETTAGFTSTTKGSSLKGSSVKDSPDDFYGTTSTFCRNDNNPLDPRLGSDPRLDSREEMEFPRVKNSHEEDTMSRGSSLMGTTRRAAFDRFAQDADVLSQPSGKHSPVDSRNNSHSHSRADSRKSSDATYGSDAAYGSVGTVEKDVPKSDSAVQFFDISSERSSTNRSTPSTNKRSSTGIGFVEALSGKEVEPNTFAEPNIVGETDSFPAQKSIAESRGSVVVAAPSGGDNIAPVSSFGQLSASASGKNRFRGQAKVVATKSVDKINSLTKTMSIAEDGGAGGEAHDLRIGREAEAPGQSLGSKKFGLTREHLSVKSEVSSPHTSDAREDDNMVITQEHRENIQKSYLDHEEDKRQSDEHIPSITNVPSIATVEVAHGDDIKDCHNMVTSDVRTTRMFFLWKACNEKLKNGRIQRAFYGWKHFLSEQALGRLIQEQNPEGSDADASTIAELIFLARQLYKPLRENVIGENNIVIGTDDEILNLKSTRVDGNDAQDADNKLESVATVAANLRSKNLERLAMLFARQTAPLQLCVPILAGWRRWSSEQMQQRERDNRLRGLCTLNSVLTKVIFREHYKTQRYVLEKLIENCYPSPDYNELSSHNLRLLGNGDNSLNAASPETRKHTGSLLDLHKNGPSSGSGLNNSSVNGSGLNMSSSLNMSNGMRPRSRSGSQADVASLSNWSRAESGWTGCSVQEWEDRFAVVTNELEMQCAENELQQKLFDDERKMMEAKNDELNYRLLRITRERHQNSISSLGQKESSVILRESCVFLKFQYGKGIKRAGTARAEKKVFLILQQHSKFNLAWSERARLLSNGSGAKKVSLEDGCQITYSWRDACWERDGLDGSHNFLQAAKKATFGFKPFSRSSKNSVGNPIGNGLTTSSLNPNGDLIPNFGESAGPSSTGNNSSPQLQQHYRKELAFLIIGKERDLEIVAPTFRQFLDWYLGLQFLIFRSQKDGLKTLQWNFQDPEDMANTLIMNAARGSKTLLTRRQLVCRYIGRKLLLIYGTKLKLKQKIIQSIEEVVLGM